MKKIEDKKEAIKPKPIRRAYKKVKIPARRRWTKPETVIAKFGGNVRMDKSEIGVKIRWSPPLNDEPPFK